MRENSNETPGEKNNKNQKQYEVSLCQLGLLTRRQTMRHKRTAGDAGGVEPSRGIGL